MTQQVSDTWHTELFHEAAGRFSLKVWREGHSEHQVFVEPNTLYMRCIDCKGFEYRKTCEHLKKAVGFLHDNHKITDADFKNLMDGLQLAQTKRAV